MTNKRKRRIFSERIDLIWKSREAVLSAVQIYNNPLISFKSESFIVLSIIGWTYLMHSYYRTKNIEYRYFETKNKVRRFKRNQDGSYRYWELSTCINIQECPLDKDTINNLKFLTGLRNQIEHRKAGRLDSYLSARYQACILNFNYYLKKFYGEKYGLDDYLALSLQFAELDYSQAQIIKDKDQMIPQNITSYIAEFDSKLSNTEIESERYAYRLLFTKIIAKREGQADRVIEFLDPKSELAKNISKEYWVKEEKEKDKFIPSQIVAEVRKLGFDNFKMYQHTSMWEKHNAKDPNKGFGVKIVKTWYWYRKWFDFVICELRKEKESKIK